MGGGEGWVTVRGCVRREGKQEDGEVEGERQREKREERERERKREGGLTYVKLMRLDGDHVVIVRQSPGGSRNPEVRCIAWYYEHMREGEGEREGERK